MIHNRKELPEQNNFYASFKGVSKGKIKDVLERKGWSCRKYNWTDFELINEWSELVLEGKEDEPLLNGAVMYENQNIDIIDKTFKTLGGYFVYEFYDNNKNLIFEKRNDS